MVTFFSISDNECICQKITIMDALQYMKEVQCAFHDSGEKFDKFMDVMKDYKFHRIDVGIVVEKMEEILKDHGDLILGFNKFLPKGYEILLLDEGEDGFGNASKYLKKIQDRFENKDHVYKSFLNILLKYKNNGVTLYDTYLEAATLFEGHRDLLPCLKLGHLTLFHEQVAVSSAKPPPKPDPEVDDPLYLMTLTIPELFLRPYQVTWDATVFGVFNPDFPLYIKTKTSPKSHTVSIQRSGQSQFESESYIKIWMQSSKRDVYLGAYLNGQKGSTECGYYVMHWMSTIILGTFRNNWEAYFNDPRPLELERLKALQIQWAHYYLRAATLFEGHRDLVRDFTKHFFQYQIMSVSGQKITIMDALQYIKEVQCAFHDNREKFDKFMDVMKDYKFHRIDVGIVVEKMEEILKDHRDLILGFNKFLPKGYEILLLDEGEDGFGNASKYLKKIQDRFENKDHVYKSFLNILLKYKNNGVTLYDTYHEVKRGAFSKKGVQIAIGPLGPSRFFLQKGVASGGSNLARLGELGGKLLPYFAINKGRSEGKREEVQEKVKADMEAMKEKMATMMEAMISMKKMMEANAVTIAATSTVAKTHEIPHHNLADFEPCLGYATEGQAVGGIPLQNTLEGPQYHPQLHLLHSTISKNPHAMAEMGNEEDEKEGEAHAVTVIPIQPSFPPTQQCHYSANSQLSPYPPPSYPQRPSLNQPQTRKPVEFTPIPVSYAYLLPYLLDNSMLAITPAKVHQPPFLREYDSNATCACHGEAPGRSIEHGRALKRKVQGLTDAGQPIVRAHPERETITHLQCIPGQDFTRAAAKRRARIMRTNMTNLTWIWMTLLFSNILPSDHNANLHLQMYRLESRPQDAQWTRRSPTGPWGIVPTRRPVDPKKSNRALGFPALGSRLQDTQWTRRSPTGSWSCQALITGLCEFYGVPVAPNNVIRSPTNRAFIKKYCVPRQAQGETPQQHEDGRQRATNALPSPLEFTSAHPQKALFAIILGTFRNNWETYFNDPSSLEPERLKALRIQWAHYYLRIMSVSGQKITIMDALQYIKEVQCAFHDSREKFDKFMDVMKDYKFHMGMHLVKRGVQIAIGPLGPSRFFLQKVVASTGSNLARLGELGGKLLPYFAINRGRSEGRRGSTFLALLILSKLLKKIVSVKKIQVEALPPFKDDKLMRDEYCDEIHCGNLTTLITLSVEM
ncbi:Paired amphipathic helix protein Sin3-like 1 [Glycine soja]